MLLRICNNINYKFIWSNIGGNGGRLGLRAGAGQAAKGFGPSKKISLKGPKMNKISYVHKILQVIRILIFIKNIDFTSLIYLFKLQEGKEDYITLKKIRKLSMPHHHKRSYMI